ncbi:MAG: glycine cleavage system protein R [Janthinobacterium lividum]
MNTAEMVVVITAVGRDQPGIIAALAKAVFDLGGNLDDATMTRLHGAFATMVAARLPAGKTDADARAALVPLADALGLTVTVLAVPDAHQDVAPDTLLTVYGADKPGIVYGVASALAGRGINITDMDTRVAGTPEAPVYVMQLEAVTGNLDIASDLEALKTALGVDMTAQALDAEAL